MKYLNRQEMLEKLKSFAERNNIVFEEMPEYYYHEDGKKSRFPEKSPGGELYLAPFSNHLGIRIQDNVRAIVSRDGVEPTGIIHEMGHILFGINKKMNDDEYRWFAWEWTIAKILDIEEQWKEENRHYIVSENEQDSPLYLVEDFESLYEDRMIAAQKAGIKIPTAEDFNQNI